MLRLSHTGDGVTVWNASPKMLLPRITSVYRKDLTNGGDIASPPHKYLRLSLVVKEIDYQQSLETVEGPMIIGGGGALIWPNHINKFSRYTGKKVVWGIGTNTHRSSVGKWPDVLHQFDRVGIRDWGSPYTWVPCASCLSSVFDRPTAPVMEAVVYEHKNYPLGIEGFPILRNNATMEQAVTFLMKGEIIITNSYHGAYWGSLLGRAVVLVRPFSSKFYYFKHQPPIAHGNWFDSPLVAFPQALEECREANLTFARKVISDLGSDV